MRKEYTHDGAQTMRSIQTGYAFTPAATVARETNRAHLERLQHLCRFGTEPDGAHTTITPAGGSGARRSYRVVDNAARLAAVEIALYCDPARLLMFGYSAAGDRVDVYTD